MAPIRIDDKFTTGTRTHIVESDDFLHWNCMESSHRKGRVGLRAIEHLRTALDRVGGINKLMESEKWI